MGGRLAAELAAATPAFTGADIAYTCQRAALLCVKEATTTPEEPAALAIGATHFQAAIAFRGRPTEKRNHPEADEAHTRLLARALN